MLSWALWLFEAFGYLWSLGAIGLAVALWFGAFSLPSFVRASVQQVAVALIVFAGCTFAASKVYHDGIAVERAKWEAAKLTEDKRREEVLLKTQTMLRDAMEKIDDQDADLKVKLHEVDTLSHAHDNASALPADSLRRLNAVH